MNKDWFALTYIIPWALGGTLFPIVVIIILVDGITTIEVMSFGWWQNLAIIFLFASKKMFDFKWIDELKERGFIDQDENIKKR